MNWMDQFLKQCLEGVPEGTYRDRTEKELRDHLLSLTQDLEGAGYPPEAARSLARARIGDPAELAQRCVQEWRRRSRQRWLIALEATLFDLCISAVGLLYIANERNFGKAWVSYWGIAAIVIAKFMWQSVYQLFGERRTVYCWGHLILTALQLPPILGWTLTTIIGGAFEFSGVMVPGWAGLSVHVLFFLWALANYNLITRFRRENRTAKTMQGA